jgi:ArsR family transcriptional regulator
MIDPVRAFDALAHETRLAVFRLLVPAGREGLPAGRIGERLRLAPNSLSFHLGRLSQAGLLTCRRQGRQLYYAVHYPALAAMVAFLAGECCADAPEGCLAGCPTLPLPVALPAGGCAAAASKRKET